MGHVPAEDIDGLSDAETIDAFITCPSCHEKHLTPEQIEIAIQQAANLHEFFELRDDFDDANRLAYRDYHDAAMRPSDIRPAPPRSDDPDDPTAMRAALVRAVSVWRGGFALDRAIVIHELARLVNDLQYSINQESWRGKTLVAAIDREFQPLLAALDREQVQALEREVAGLAEDRPRRVLDRPATEHPPQEEEGYDA
jgi:hypothetical protein